MKIGFFNFNYKNNNSNVINIKKYEDVSKINILFIYEKDEDKFDESLKKCFSFNPGLKFIPIIDRVNFNLIPKFMALGAITFILPPFEENIAKNIENLKESDVATASTKSNKENFYGMVAKSKVMYEIFDLIEKVATSESTVLITGESGTGKELVAKAIYKLSNRCSNPFVPVNCGSIPDELLESELFGYTKGSFTGATNNRIGRFQYADKGTIFLDEIGEMPLNLQVKLLRVLQEGEIQPIGANKPVKIDIRIVAATNKNLEKLVEEKKFREDLFYRLNVIPIHIPPLRERVEDIPVLVKYFFNKFIKKHNRKKSINGISDEAMFIMENYNWPGNVRELENTIERLVILKDKGYILPSDLPSRIFQIDVKPIIEKEPLSEKEYLNSILKLDDSGINLKEVIDNIETNLIMQALEKAGGVKDRAAKLLNMKRTTLIEKLKRKNLIK